MFVATLAEALARQGMEPVVYTNGDSSLDAEIRWCYPHAEWPLPSPLAGTTKELQHMAWSMKDADRDCDIIHINSALGVPYAQFVSRPTVCTLHHPYERALTDLYLNNPNVFYTAISHHQASLHPEIALRTIHHGLDLEKYQVGTGKRGYLSFLGRIAPIKGAHTAIEVAKEAGIPLKIAGEIQPIFRGYYEAAVKPHVDGRFIEYVGEVDLRGKNELLGGSLGLLFPIEWNEPFGLAMVEAMACGTPVFARPGGAVPEIVCDGVSGTIHSSVKDLARSIGEFSGRPEGVRGWVEEMFSAELMGNRYLNLYRDILEQTPLFRPSASSAVETEEPAA